MSKESFFTHLEAFRRMLLELLAIFMALLIPAFFCAPELLAFLQRRAAQGMDGAVLSLHYFALMEPLVVELQAAALLALGLGMPLYFWRLWHFLAPALYPGERRWIAGGAAAALGLFWSGAALAFFGVMPLMLRFSMGFARDGLTPLIGMENFVSLLLTLLIAFGVMFELPLLVLALTALGLVRIETLQRQRRMVAVVLLVAAALLTPPDVVSQLMLALPCYLLFELTLLAARFLPRRKTPVAADSEAGLTLRPPPDAPMPENERTRKKRKRIRPADRIVRRR